MLRTMTTARSCLRRAPFQTSTTEGSESPIVDHWRGRNCGPVGCSFSHELGGNKPTLSESGALCCALGKVALGAVRCARSAAESRWCTSANSWATETAMIAGRFSLVFRPRHVRYSLLWIRFNKCNRCSACRISQTLVQFLCPRPEVRPVYGPCLRLQ